MSASTAAGRRTRWTAAGHPRSFLGRQLEPGAYVRGALGEAGILDGRDAEQGVLLEPPPG